MVAYTFTEEQIETIVYVIKRTGCTFKEAYAACCETNYNRAEAKKKVDSIYEESRKARRLKREERQKERELLDKSFGPGFKSEYIDFQ